MTRIFHVALSSDWDAAQANGRYTTSTLGRSLAEEGFVHCSRGDQWQGVRERFYADVGGPLVLLVVDTDRLSAPVVEEAPPGTEETFPHVYGAIEVSAVVQVLPLSDRPAPERRSFLSLWLEEMGVRAALGLVVIVVSVGLCGLALSRFGSAVALATILVALVVGFAVVALVLRRREQRLNRKRP